MGKRVYMPKAGDYIGSENEAKEALGGKGSGTADMINMGLPVPPAAIIQTGECVAYFKRGKRMDEALRPLIRGAIAEMENRTGRHFFDFDAGKKHDILLFSVRSGSKISMPGMMETVLNLGLNDARVEALVKSGENERFVLDTYRRLMQGFGSVVLEVPSEKFEHALKEARVNTGVKIDAELPPASLRGVISEYKRIISGEGKAFLQDPFEQVWLATQAVFRSSYNIKAMNYKTLNGLPPEMPTAANIQMMVYGNRNDKSGTGVLFTRDKNTGENHVYSDYLVNAQGEDVVSGVRTPVTFTGKGGCPFDKATKDELFRIVKGLEKHYKAMLDTEYTIENGKLYMLQVRRGKSSGKAAFRIVTDMVEEGLITKEEAVERITMDNIGSVLLPQIDPASKKGVKADAKGVPASAGSGCGVVAFTAAKAKEIAQQGKGAVLVRQFTKPEDYDGMMAAGRSGGGVLTAEGGSTSHAAVVCGGNGIPAVVGCRAIKIDGNSATVNGKRIGEGDFVTIDGTSGEIFVGRHRLVPPDVTPEFRKVICWAREISRLKVYANADRPEQAAEAVKLGATGIGLCRTEHMFQDPGRVEIVQEMILAGTLEGRKAALNRLLPMQRGDFEGIFKVMGDYPVTIRLLDPPLHEFLPDHVKLEQQRALRQAGGKTDAAADALLEKVRSLREQNPMLGDRGVRLLLHYPEIMEMQARAIIEAALNVQKETGKAPNVKIMVPVVAFPSELESAVKSVHNVAKEVMNERKEKIPYKVGTMIEIPSACLRAGELAKISGFFSFGTNDLTQTALGLSRDDTSAMVARYIEKGLLAEDPFTTLHPSVGELVRMTVERGRKANPKMDIGICGEQGVDPGSIRETLYRGGLDSVSGTPKRIPFAIITAAQTELSGRR